MVGRKRAQAGQGLRAEEGEKGTAHRALLPLPRSTPARPGGRALRSPTCPSSARFQCEPQPELWMRLLGLQLLCFGSSEDQKWQQSHCYAAAVTEGPPAQGPPLKEPAGSAILALGRWAMMGGDMGGKREGLWGNKREAP